MEKEVLSPRTCGMVAGRVVRGRFIQIILPYSDMCPAIGVELPSLVCICCNRCPKARVGGQEAVQWIVVFRQEAPGIEKPQKLVFIKSNITHQACASLCSVLSSLQPLYDKLGCTAVRAAT